MSVDKRALLKQWLASGEARLQPLTFPQRELWEASPVPAGDPANHICCVIQVRGLLTPRDCHVSIQRVVERQEALRLSILPGKEQPLQMIRAAREANLHYRELSAAQAQPEGLEEIAQSIFGAPFDMVQGPLYRAEVLRRSVDDHVIVLSIHHSIADGWTLGVFVQDLFGSYVHTLMGSTDPLPAVPTTYTDWGAAERAYWQPAQLASRASFWKTHLAGTPRLWTKPETAAAQTRLPTRWLSAVPADLGAAARDLARRSGATLFSTLLAAFQLALSHWTKADDIVVGTPVANRNKQATHETMGSFSGIVPIRGQVDRARTFAGALQAAHHSTVEALGHAMPFVELVRALGEPVAPGYNPIFEVRFALQNHPLPDVSLPNLAAKLRMRSTGTARFDLACELTEDGDALEIAWVYRPDLFSAADLQELDTIYRSVLAAACRSPQSQSSALLP